MNITPVKRALISVSNKTHIVQFAKDLIDCGVEIISTGGTSAALQAAQIPHRQVEDITKLPSMLDGRVKTLHPHIHGGILGRRDVHATEVAQHGIGWIDLVVVNFYPFAEALAEKQMSWDEAVEYIDIGGPTMVRAAAKNFAWTGVVVDPNDYTSVITALRGQKGLDFNLRKRLAQHAFALTSRYDNMIHDYFLAQQTEEVACPAKLNLQLEKITELRYGENPHQKASAYRFQQTTSGVLAATQQQGKPLSYNNILDAEAAWSCVQEFAEPACVIVKHANPCGVATASSIDDAYLAALATDPVSAFGGIVALNRPCTANIAAAITEIFMEVVLAPSFTPEALALFGAKPNLRVLMMSEQTVTPWEMKFIHGGVLLQEKDRQLIAQQDLQIVTQQKPSDEDIAAMLFAWRALKHVKSNGILIAKNNSAVAIGAGQVSRIDAVDLAVRKAGEKIQGSILASDAFFPFRDSIDRIAHTGVRAIIQPGGSMRDAEVIAACNEHQIAMVFTGTRCFRH